MNRQEFQINNFDLLRLLAATQVVIAHSSHYFVLDEGIRSVIRTLISPFPGVPVFFVISGFLISASWLRGSQNLRSYSYSRFLRIYPALWAAVCFSVLIVIFTGNFPSVDKFAVWLATQVSVLQIYNPEFLRDFGVGAINGSLWTIPVELSFYIFVPLFFIFLSKYRPLASRVALLLLFVVSFAVYVISYELKAEGSFYGKLVSLSIFAHLWQFIMGVFLYLYLDKIKHLLINKSIFWLIIYLIAFIAYKLTPDTLNVIPLLISRLIMACFVISFAYSYVSFLEPKTRMLGGDYSYGTYLYHALFINIFVQYGFHHGLGAIALLLVLTYLCAFLSWRFIESPALKLKKVMMSRSQTS